MKQRTISAIILILVVTPFIIIGKIPFQIFASVVGVLATFELLQFRKKLPIYHKIITYIFVLILINSNLIKINLSILIQIIILGYLVLLLFTKRNKYHYKDAFYLIGLVLFIGISFNNFIIVRNMNLYVFIYLLLIAIITDTFALFVGKKFGKHKLAPLISPNKTIEGLVGGCFIGTIISTIYYLILIKDLNILLALLITLFLSIIGQAGDLIKSQIKRYENVKDFSNLIPGHGGIIDRLDSFTFITITYILIFNFI